MTIIDRLLSMFVVPDRERLRNLHVPELADLRQQLDQARRLAGEAQARFREAAGVRDRLASELSKRNDEAGDGARERDRLAAELARVERISLDQLSNTTDALNRLAGCAKERDQLREQLTMEMKNATRLAAEGDQLRARVAELEAGRGDWVPRLNRACSAGCGAKTGLDIMTICDPCKDALPPGLWTLYVSFAMPVRRAAATLIEALIKTSLKSAAEPEDGQPITYVDPDKPRPMITTIKYQAAHKETP